MRRWSKRFAVGLDPTGRLKAQGRVAFLRDSQCLRYTGVAAGDQGSWPAPVDLRHLALGASYRFHREPSPEPGRHAPGPERAGFIINRRSGGCRSRCAGTGRQCDREGSHGTHPGAPGRPRGAWLGVPPTAERSAVVGVLSHRNRNTHDSSVPAARDSLAVRGIRLILRPVTFGRRADGPHAIARLRWRAWTVDQAHRLVTCSVRPGTVFT